MNLRVTIALMAAKLSRSAIHLLGRGGASAFPGKLALSICPDILRILSENVTCIIVTGTNGKTTTSRMVETLLKDSGRSYFANRSGANLYVGITTDFCVNATLTGKNKYDWAVLECDEAAFKQVGAAIDPAYVIVTNVFRDQLDRFGEVTATLENIKIGAKNSPNAVLCLNGDCSMTASIAEEVANPVLFYGVNAPIYQDKVQEASDAPYCIHCNHPYEYKYITYGHLGDYRCPNCGYARPLPDVAVRSVAVSDESHSEFTVEKDGLCYDINLPVPGAYNIYNAAATCCLAAALGDPLEDVANDLAAFEAGFGRMEEFDLSGTPARMILVKNPAGCNQVLNFLSNVKEPAHFSIILNDNYGDGRDVSWIWDVDFEKLAVMENLTQIVVGGLRAYDMATRLKYAGVSPEKILVAESPEAVLAAVTAQDQPAYIMPTYSAMMDVRGIISKQYGYKDFWE